MFFFDESLKTNINKLNTKKHTLYYYFFIYLKMRYKIVKMTKEEIKNFHPCELCDCARGAFCLYPAECPAKENEFIKKVYK